MYKLQSNGAFHMSGRIGIGYDNMQLKPDYHDNRHFSLINNLDMKELNSCKAFDYVKKPHAPISYSTTPSCNNTSYSLSNYQVLKEEKSPVPPSKLEMTGKCEDHRVERANSTCQLHDQNGKAQQKSRKRKRNRKRKRRNQNRKNNALINNDYNDISSPLITQFCAITIEPSDKIDGCCSPKHTSTIVRPNSTTIPLIRSCRTRLPSDCESEDSFIIFGDENVPALIYPQCKTRLQSDCISEDSFIVFDGGNQGDCEEFVFDSSTDDCDQLPRKKVRFASEENLCEIHPMIQWSYAYQEARKGPWEQFALDRMRFQNRVVNLQPVLGPILDPSHRNKIYKERFEGCGLD